MIIGIGCDIVEHKLTFKLDWIGNPEILKRVFSNSEIEECSKYSPKKYYSSRFAIKEAVLKCLGMGMEDGIALNNIETEKMNTGSLNLILQGNVKKIADSKNITNWHISLSHSKEYSVAVVVAESRK